MNSGKDPVKPVEPPLQVMPTTGKPEDQEAEIPQKTCPPFAGLTIPSCTVGEYLDSLESMDEESVNEESERDCQVLSATLKNFMRNEDGGFTLMFEVPEMDRSQVAHLVEMGTRVFNLVVISNKNSVPFQDE